MTNVFKSLDAIFPCGKERLSGEVVGITVSFTQFGVLLGTAYWKRKAWYVNASVNAWHLHRGLCAEFRDDYSKFCLDGCERALKRALGRAVMYSYLINNLSHEQGFHYTIELANENPYAVLQHFNDDHTEVLSEVTVSDKLLCDTWECIMTVREMHAEWHDLPKWEIVPFSFCDYLTGKPSK